LKAQIDLTLNYLFDYLFPCAKNVLHQGAWVTATDLPDVLSNLNFNLSRNTRGRCRYTPQVAALTWGQDVKQNFPSSVYHYNYVLCTDVVYHHSFLEDLLITMQYFCKPGTTVLLANKVRLCMFFI